MSASDPLLDSAPKGGTGAFQGGVTLHPDTAAATAQPIATMPVPDELVLPLSQHAGAPAKPVVAVGDRVLRGQMIAAADGFVSAAIHAPTSGTITALEPRPVPHPGGLEGPCFVLASDGADAASETASGPRDYLHTDPALVRSWVRDAGIVGLGGAGFPASVKLTAEADQQVQTLLLNGAECDPHICCDDMLMRERAAAVVEGGRIMLHVLQIHDCVIAIEEDKPEALAAMREAVEAADDDRLKVKPVPAVYPQGGEKQLIQSLSGREVPSDGLPLDIGFVCHNVGTAAATADSVLRGEPLISRVVTVTGNGIRTPQNVLVRLGTPLHQLVAFCGGYTDKADRLIVGGSMMGIALPHDNVPVVKSTDCLVALEPENLRTAVDAMPCIRCGECAAACPASLLPQQLHWHAQSHKRSALLQHNLFDCIECGCCDVVCPSHIPLTQTFRHAKARLRLDDAQRAQADVARRRYDAREQRLAQAKVDAAARREARKAARAAQPEDPQEAVRQAVARARAKRKAKRKTSEQAASNETAAANSSTRPADSDQ
ncbi:MAG: electron transport complex subunit RsxC [Pseudomonadota bacterium]